MKLKFDDDRIITIIYALSGIMLNVSESENLVTVMWANEQFDPEQPDTFFEEV